MRPGAREFSARAAGSRQQGLGLATALFVITVMAVLAVIINQLIRSNAESIEEEINLVRSFYTAESGIQYGLNRAFPPDGSMSACPAVFTPPAIDVQGLNNCSMSIQCDTFVADGDTYYTITSAGTCGDVTRTIQVRAE